MIQAYNDEDENEVVTKASTVSRANTKVALSMAALQKGVVARTRHITQACTRSDTALARQVICEDRKEFCLSQDSVLVAVRPLYGIPEAGMYRYVTYANYHKSIGMKTTSLDPYLFVGRENDAIDGIFALQADDRFIFGAAAFSSSEVAAGKQFPTKDHDVLTSDHDEEFKVAMVLE